MDNNENNVIDLNVLRGKLTGRKIEAKTIRLICECADYVGALDHALKKLSAIYAENRNLVESGFIGPKVIFDNFVKNWNGFTTTILEERK